MKVALVHDYLVEAGGAERVLAALHELFPEAPIYTSVYDPRTALPALRGAKIVTSFLQQLPHSRRFYKWWLPLYPVAFEQFDLSEYDVVISSTSSFAKGVITGPDTLHLCYCHTPSRFAWRQHDYLRRESAGIGRRLALSWLLHQLRTWDFSAAQRVDVFLANCRNTQQRIRKFYGRRAEILHAPVDTSFYCPADTPAQANGQTNGHSPIAASAPLAAVAAVATQPAPAGALLAASAASQPVAVSASVLTAPFPAVSATTLSLPFPPLPAGAYFLVASRLAPYKRVDLAVQACTTLRLPLVVVGSGVDLPRLKQLAGPTVQFAGQVSDEALRGYYRGCAAVIFPGEEDFGLVPLEANACGRPVIAYRAGGALETVVEGVTGVFFDAQTPESLAAVLERFDPRAFDPATARQHALRFDKQTFKQRVLDFIQPVSFNQSDSSSQSGARISAQHTV